MRVLQINKFFFQFGGVERYMFGLSDLLRSHGHDVDFFAMRHPRNLPSAQSSYFVSHIEYRNTTWFRKLRWLPRTIGKTVYSFESKRRLRALVRARRPDVAHVHLISHQISPSILDVLRDERIPTVQTVHEYKLVCPSYHLYLHDRHEICERCLGGRYYHAVLQRCLHGSLAGSGLAAAAQYIHRGLKLYEKNIDLFLAPSQFLADKLVEGGLPPDKIRVRPLWIDYETYEPRYEPGPYLMFFGRLSPEKGLMTLLRAMAEMPDVPLRVVGEGPERPVLGEWIRSRGLTNVTFEGFQDGARLRELIRGGALTVLPSLWYENSPLAVYESHASGKPVVASRIGGIPELVDDGATGYLVDPGDVRQLVARIRSLLSDPATCESMGRRGRDRLANMCNDHYAGLTALYDEARAAGR